MIKNHLLKDGFFTSAINVYDVFYDSKINFIKGVIDFYEFFYELNIIHWVYSLAFSANLEIENGSAIKAIAHCRNCLSFFNS